MNFHNNHYYSYFDSRKLRPREVVTCSWLHVWGAVEPSIKFSSSNSCLELIGSETANETLLSWLAIKVSIFWCSHTDARSIHQISLKGCWWKNEITLLLERQVIYSKLNNWMDFSIISLAILKEYNQLICRILTPSRTSEVI